jgi:hypothetical protein
MYNHANALLDSRHQSPHLFDSTLGVHLSFNGREFVITLMATSSYIHV